MNGKEKKELTIKDILQEVCDAFVTDKRADGTEFTKLKDKAPKWLTRDGDSPCFMLRIHQAVDDRFPDDWIYKATADIAGSLADYSAETANGLRDMVGECADSYVDVHNANLTKWLASHLANIALCDEAVTEFGVGSSGGVIGYIQSGQYHAYNNICMALIDECQKELERRQ